MMFLKYCNVHDSLWEEGDLCEYAIIHRYRLQFLPDACRFIRLRAERERR